MVIVSISLRICDPCSLQTIHSWDSRFEPGCLDSPDSEGFLTLGGIARQRRALERDKCEWSGLHQAFREGQEGGETSPKKHSEKIGL